jgi:predicted HTH transcriptional regulator
MANDSRAPTTLRKDEIEQIKALVLRHLQDHDHITNRLLRELSGVTYDQAIYFFRQMIKQELLDRIGTTSNIHYVLSVRRLKKQK